MTKSRLIHQLVLVCILLGHYLLSAKLPKKENKVGEAIDLFYITIRGN